MEEAEADYKKPTGTILQRLKQQLKNSGYDVTHVQTISQALRMFDRSVTGNTIAGCLDDVYPGIVSPYNESEPEDETDIPLDPPEAGIV